MSIYTQLLLLTWVVVFVVDLSGAVGSLGAWLGKPVRRPFSCSLCCTWWAGLILAAVRGCIMDARVVAFVALCAWLTGPTAALSRHALDLLHRLINKIQ